MVKHYVVLLDTSISMKPYMQKAINGLNNYFLKLPLENYITIITFSHNISYIIKSSKKSFFNKLKLNQINFGYSTRLYDCIKLIISEFKDSFIDTEIHIITDGDDNCSQTNKQEIENICNNIIKYKGWKITYYNPFNNNLDIKNINNVNYDLNDIDSLLENLSI